MFTPVNAMAYRAAAFVARRTTVAFWTAFRPHRDVSATLGVSAALHLAVFLIIGSSMYDSGEDDSDVPELSVQIESRDGPNEDEFRDASLPKPAPDPVEEVLDDPGTQARESVDAEAVADRTPQEQRMPDAQVAEQSTAEDLAPPEPAAVLTTTSPSDDVGAMAPEPRPDTAIAAIPQPEQTMLTNNVQLLAQKLLDTNM